MKRLILSCLLLSQPALAEPNKLLHKLHCDNKETIEQSLQDNYGERPIAKGKVGLITENDKVHKLDMVFYVSPDNRSYTLVGYTEDEYGCIMATGTEFGQYTDDKAI